MKRKLAIPLACLMLAGTSRAAPPAWLEPLAPIPSAWGQVEGSRLDDSVCPKVTGEYFIIPEVFEKSKAFPDGTIHPGKRGDYIPLFLHPRDYIKPTRDWRILDTPVPEDQLNFRIRQDQPDKFELRVLNLTGVKQAFSIFDRSARDFDCFDGYIEINFPNSGVAHTEGVAFENKIYRRFTRAADGALIFYEQHDQWSRKLLVTQANVTQRYLRFRPTHAKVE